MILDIALIWLIWAYGVLSGVGIATVLYTQFLREAKG